MMKKFFLSFLLVFAAISLAHAESAFDRVVRTKTLNCGYIIVPPYIIKDVNTGAMTGINVEAIDAIGRNLGLK